LGHSNKPNMRLNMHYQNYALNNDEIYIETHGVAQLLPFMPKGIIGIDYKTGLVDIMLTKDKPTKMKVGRYLMKLGRTEAEAKEKSEELAAIVQLVRGAELRFATTEEEIIRVYEDGPKSCMSGSSAVAVYAYLDTAVAYAVVDDKIVARSVVAENRKNNIPKTFVRAYGDKNLLKTLLEDAGYREGALHGCRLKKIEDGLGNIRMPFLDCGTPVDVMDDHLYVNRCGEYKSGITSGILITCTCEICGESVVEEYSFYCEEISMRLCEECYNEEMVYVGSEYVHKSSPNIVQLNCGDWIYKDYAVYSEYEGAWYDGEDCTYSEEDEDYFLNDDVVEAYTCEKYTSMCFIDNCTEIEGTWVHNDFVEEYKELIT